LTEKNGMFRLFHSFEIEIVLQKVERKKAEEKKRKHPKKNLKKKKDKQTNKQLLHAEIYDQYIGEFVHRIVTYLTTHQHRYLPGAHQTWRQAFSRGEMPPLSHPPFPSTVRSWKAAGDGGIIPVNPLQRPSWPVSPPAPTLCASAQTGRSRNVSQIS